MTPTYITETILCNLYLKYNKVIQAILRGTEHADDKLTNDIKALVKTCLTRHTNVLVDNTILAKKIADLVVSRYDSGVIKHGLSKRDIEKLRIDIDEYVFSVLMENS